MPRYRHALPQLGDRLFLTDGGAETTFVFNDGIELRDFAAFELIEDEAGRAHARRYFVRYLEIARSHGVGFVLETLTWRASSDWGDRLGYSASGLDRVNRRSVEHLEELRDAYETPGAPIVISGCLGPRGDGYVPGARMTVREATAYHHAQIATFQDTNADLVTAMTLPYVEEAVGIARAARALDMPCVISFTVETNGRLPTGQPLRSAVEQVDAETGGAPAYYMINCAHPTHFADALATDEAWTARLGGLRSNASCKSHAELDACTELDEGDPVELGRQTRQLWVRLGHVNVLGGCCGTDHRHIAAIAGACRAARAGAR